MRRALHDNADLIVVGLGALAGAAAASGPAGPVRVVLGLDLCLFLPGYALTAALYAKAGELRWAERIALSIGSSLVLLILIALALDYSPWAHDPQSTTLTLSGATVLLALSAWLHRAAIGSAGSCVWPGFQARLPTPGRIIFTLAAVAVLGMGLSWLGRPAPSEAFTSFSVLRGDGTSGPYVTSGGEMPVIVGVTNHEGHRTSYRIEVLRGRSTVAAMQATVANGATWRHPVGIAVPRAARALFQILLFRTVQPHHVYRCLLLRPTHP